jgi:hypothetical protein
MNVAAEQMNTPLEVRRSTINYLEPANVAIKPYNTQVIVDTSGKSTSDHADTKVKEYPKPLLTVKSTRIEFDALYPTASDIDPGVRLEMACIMLKRSMTRYQALYIDGTYAFLRFVQVPDVDLIFRNNKSRIDSARYGFPEDRNGFVCHLVNLVRKKLAQCSLTSAVEEQ